jgi:hypothetical protein
MVSDPKTFAPELTSHIDGKLQSQRWIVDGLKVASTFAIGVAAAIDASAWQEQGPTALGLWSAWLLAASAALLIALFFASRIDGPDLDAILADAHVGGLSNDEVSETFLRSALQSVRENARVVEWMIRLNLIIILASVASGALSAIALLA